MSEKVVLQIMKQLLKAVKYLHERKIAHRDIKPSNMLLLDGMLKLSDFGCAIFIKNEKDTECCQTGTRAFKAPEALLGFKSSFEQDLWAVGITCVNIYSGKLPINEKTDILQVAKIFSFLGSPNENNWPSYSEDAKDFFLTFKQQDVVELTTLLNFWDMKDCSVDTFKAVVQPLLTLGPTKRASANDLLESSRFQSIGDSIEFDKYSS